MDIPRHGNLPASLDVGGIARVTIKSDIFSGDKITRHVDIGPDETLIEVIEAAGLKPKRGCTTHVFVGGDEAPLEAWVAPCPRGQPKIDVVQVPNFGGDAASTGRLAATLAIVIAASALAPGVGTAVTGLTGSAAAGGVASAIFGATIAIGGSLAVAALIPPPSDDDQGDDDFDVSTVTGQSNQIRQYAPIPSVKGDIRVFPNHLARPYTETAGNDVIIRILLAVGVGPLDISDIRISDTPIGSIPGVEFETRQGTGSEPDLTLFTRDVFEENPNQEIRRENGAILKVTQADTTEVTIDITFPNGIFDRRKDGKRDPFRVDTRFEIQINSTGPFVNFFAGGDNFRSLRRETSRVIRKTYRRKGLPTGDPHTVRITRLTGDSSTDTNNVSRQFLTAFRSIQPTDVWPERDIAVIALRVKKDGPVERISCRAESLVDDFNGSIWVPLQKTNNPAALARSVLKDNANPTPVGDPELRDDLFEAWYQTSDTEGWAFNGVFEDRNSTVLDALKLIGTAGRARPTLPDGKYGFVQDVLQTTPVALITAHNSSGLTIRKSWNPPPLGLRVQFRNENTEFQPDERLVFDDGFDELNTPADRIELLDLTRAGVTDPDLAYRHGRFYIGNAKFRPEVFTTSQSLDALVVDVGDYAELQHDVILSRLGSARITSLTIDGGSNVTTITVNNLFDMEIAQSYAVTIRSIVGGASQINTFPIDTVSGKQETLTFTTPVPPANAPSVGDLLAFGVAGVVTQPALVTDITGQEGISAQIVMTQLASQLHAFDTGPVPPFSSNIVLPGNYFAQPPAVPTIETVTLQEISLQTAPDVVHQIQIEVSLRGPNSERPSPLAYEIRLRELGEDDWPIQQSYPGDTRTLLIAPQTVGLTYELQVRAIGLSTPGRTNASDWTAIRTVNVPSPDQTSTDIFAVTGLELLGQSNNAQFEGRNPTFNWRISSLRGSTRFGAVGTEIAFAEPGFAYFKVQILDPSDNLRRREEIIATPTYTYDYDKNAEDSRRLGGGPALRDFIMRVAVVDNFSREGRFASLRVNNPAPAVPGGLRVTNGVSAITIEAQFPTDPDFEGMIVWASENTGFTPSPSNEIIRGRQNVVTLQATPGQDLFIRVAFFDAFDSDIATLNISSELLGRAIEVGVTPEFTFNDILIQPNSPGPDQVSWSGGTVEALVNGVRTTTTVLAGNATYPGVGILYLYYVLGGTTLIATDDADQALGPNNQVLATYRGGDQLRTGNGDVFTDGALLVANTVLATALKAGSITARELSATTLIVDNAQIGTAVVGTLELINGAVTDLVNDFATDAVFTTTVGVYKTVLSQTITTDGQFNVSISFSVEYRNRADAVSDPEIQGRAQVLRDGVPLQNWAFGRARGAGLSQVTAQDVISVVGFVDEAPPSGPHLYEIQTKPDFATATSLQQRITARSLELRITKR